MSGSARSSAVDVHAHSIPTGLLTTLRRVGRAHGVEVNTTQSGTVLTIGGRTTPPIPAALTDLSGRLAAMDRMGVGCQLLSPWMELTATPLSPEAARWYVRAVNDAMALDVATTAGRLAGLGTVALADPTGAAAEVHRCITELGLVGIEIASSGPGIELDDPALEPFWRAAGDHAALILVHPMRPLGGPRLDVHRLGDIVGNPSESGLAVGRLLLGGLFERQPDLRVCAVHGGGVLPYLAGRFEALAALGPGAGRAAAVSTGLKSLYFDSLTHSTRALGWLVEFAGPHRVLLGSDFPFETGCADPVGPVLNLPGLSDAERAAVLYGNVRRLLAELNR